MPSAAQSESVTIVSNTESSIPAGEPEPQSSLRERILKRSGVLPERTLSIEEWDGDEVLVIGMDAATRGRMMQAFADSGTGKINITESYVDTLIECAYDPLTREHLFSEADRGLIRSLAGRPVEMIWKTAMDLSGMQADAVGTAAGNS